MNLIKPHPENERGGKNDRERERERERERQKCATCYGVSSADGLN